MPGWDNNFDDFKRHLTVAFANPLPGADAQYKLVPPGRPRPNLEEIKATREPRFAGVLALFYPFNNVPHLALMKRNTYPGVHSGQISLPGGQKENVDADLVETALREAHEEVGVPPTDVVVIGNLSEVYIPPSNFLVLPVVGIAHARPAFKLDDKEVHSLLEIPLAAFLDANNLKQATVDAGGYTLQVPSFQVHNEVIWGATAMMISELVAVLTSQKTL